MIAYASLPPPDSFENRLRRARLIRGLSAAEFATRVGKPRESVYQWEGGRTPTMKTLRNLAEALGVNLAWLIGGEGPMDSIPSTTKDPVAAESSVSSSNSAH